MNFVPKDIAQMAIRRRLDIIRKRDHEREMNRRIRFLEEKRLRAERSKFSYLMFLSTVV